MGLIYRITCKENGAVYIGSTIHDLPSTRWGIHEYALKAGRHSNRFLQSAWDTWGAEVFEWEVVEQNIMPSELIQAERDWYKKAKAEGEVFNIAIPGGKAWKGHEYQHGESQTVGKRHKGKRKYVCTDNWF